ncbi:MAG: metal-dependent transcriptional regulator [Bacteroidota bacterium]|nr:metal-dependent transcriptional regulator [Bacteroidota bacterium]MDE2834091.1 metal-dependent transcriptional regulator [Bacteroidota bacterium]MDE2956187.1 metal-dependent transcriptional regulator [Bacteroidota bacterium]
MALPKSVESWAGAYKRGVEFTGMMRSPAVEDYIKTIFNLQEQSPTVATTDIARAMDVAAASVTGMVKRLARMNLVAHESYKGVRLTPAGEKIALEIIRHHRLLETYLKEIMGYSWEEMHREAEHLEHHISETFEERIDALLGYPTHDPHGHPIPTPDLKLTRTKTFPLEEAEVDKHYVIRHLSDADVAVLDFIERVGLMPGRRIQVISQDEGHVTISIEGTVRKLEPNIAGSIHVDARI